MFGSFMLPGRRLLGIASILVLALASFAGLGSRAEAAPRTLVVNATDDVDDGTCNAQHCSFREALTRAAETPGGDRIVFERDVFPRDVPVVVQSGPSTWFVPDDTKVDGTGSDVILQGAAGYYAALGLGSRTVIRGLTIHAVAGGYGQTAVLTTGDENILSDDTLVGDLFPAVTVTSGCTGGDQSRDNQVVRSEIVGGITLGGNTCGVDGTVITFNDISGGFVGALLWNTSNTTITSNTFTGNRYGIELEVQTSDVRIMHNNIAGNVDYGLIYSGAGPTILDAEHNWWGSSDGPSGEGPGAGDRIYGPVDFDRWSRHPFHN